MPVDPARTARVDTVLLAEPRGFCAGVEMAIKALAWMVRAFDPPVYCYHEIVHNRLVVERFREQGVIFVDDVDEVPPGAPLMLSAHGSAPEVVAAASAEGRYVVNAVCPLVTKVHHEAKVRARKGYTVLYVGHTGHDEAVGTLAVAPDSIHLLEREEQLDELLEQVDDPERVAMLAQTTLAHNEWTDLLTQTRERFPQLWTASRNDLCFATTNRQTALTRIATAAHAVVVIGSANSSNTIALTKVARDAGCPIVLRVDGPEELDLDALGGRDDRRRDRGRECARRSRRVGDREARTGARRGSGAGHRRGRVLPPAARVAGVDPRAGRGRGVRVRRRSEARARGRRTVGRRPRARRVGGARRARPVRPERSALRATGVTPRAAPTRRRRSAAAPRPVAR